MKKIISLMLAVLMLFACAACSQPADSTPTGASADTNATTDFDYIKGKGKLVIGITDFKPMDYKDDNGNWIGFDADLAKAFAENLGVEVEFVEIVWNQKINELNGKTVDCVWNGMTLTDDVKAAMATSNPYMTNAQVVVVPTAKADLYKTAEDCKSLNFAVEVGSGGKDAAEENGFSFIEAEKQTFALTEVASGNSDAAIIDLLMAGATIGEGTDYADLTYTVKLNSEEYGVGFRKGSDLADKLNSFLSEYTASGKLEELANTYGVQEAIVK